MSIYRLYAQNGNSAGFWVQHRSWNNACARVLTIAGQTHGPLPGSAPLHDNAPVIAENYDVRSGRISAPGAALDHPADNGFTRIAEPSWSRGSAAHVA